MATCGPPCARFLRPRAGGVTVRYVSSQIMYASASKRLVLFVGGALLVAIRCDAPATELGVMGDVPAEAAFNASPHTSRPSS